MVGGWLNGWEGKTGSVPYSTFSFYPVSSSGGLNKQMDVIIHPVLYIWRAAHELTVDLTPDSRNGY